METSITTNEKKAFIQWFLKTHQMKSREAVWILNYIAKHERITKYIHFINDLKGVSRGLVLTAYGIDKEPLRFFKQNMSTSNAEKVFHDIRLNWDEDLFIQLHFKKSNRSPEYALVCEDNPRLPLKVNDQDKEIAEAFLNKVKSTFSKQLLLQAIDKALDHQDKKEFHFLSSLYKQEVENMSRIQI